MRFYIYLIINSVNGKKYVGKTNDPWFRWSKHKVIAKGGKEKYPKDFSALHGSIAKYGKKHFTFEILEEFDNEHDAYIFEIWWIDYYGTFIRKNGYNLNNGGEGGIRPTEETIKKLCDFQNRPDNLKKKKQLMLERHKNNPGFLSSVHKGNTYCLGKKASQETKDKMSKAHKGRSTSEETRKKLSEAFSGENSSSAKLTEPQVLEIRNKYPEITINNLAKEYKVSCATIKNIIARKSWKKI